METHQTGPPMVLCSSELVHYWFSCGFVCGADVVQIWHTLAPLWSNVGSVSFRCCTLAVQGWFKFGSNVLQVWFNLGSDQAMFLNHWFNVGSGFMPSWFMVGSMVVQICLMFGFGAGSSVVQLWLRFGSGLVQIRTRFRCCSDLALIGFKFGSTLVQIWFTLGSTRFKAGSMLVYTLS